MLTYLNIAEIIVSVVLIVAVLMQVKGAGGGVFGGGQTTFRTRRGLERILFQFTLVLGGIFVLLAIISLLAA